MSTLGNRLKRLRKEKRWTQSEVANKLGLKGHSTYSNWEYDRTQPDADMLARIAEVFSVSVDWLTGRTKNKDDIVKEGITDGELSIYRKKAIEAIHKMSEEEVNYFYDLMKRITKE